MHGLQSMSRAVWKRLKSGLFRQLTDGAPLTAMSRYPPAMRGKIALVTGASRGAGRGIALQLGEAGATVYVTGRTTREKPADVGGTIEDTADEVTRRGGRGIAVRCDHADDTQVE